MTDYERGYRQGYADAMNWKTQNHLEHLPGRQELVIDCPRCGHCCPQPNQEPVKDKLDFWALFDENQRLRAELKFNITPPQQWVGLTDEEIKEIIGPWGNTPIKGYTRKLFDQIEAKLREKNEIRNP
jgi:hypothetical protein